MKDKCPTCNNFPCFKVLCFNLSLSYYYFLKGLKVILEKCDICKVINSDTFISEKHPFYNRK